MFLCFFFFFSSRRRHTRCSRDWSSDVCSSDLHAVLESGEGQGDAWEDCVQLMTLRSEERRVGKSVDLGGRRIIKKKKKKTMKWNKNYIKIEIQLYNEKNVYAKDKPKK